MTRSLLAPFAFIALIVVGSIMAAVSFTQPSAYGQQQPPTTEPDTQMPPPPRYPVPYGQQPPFAGASNFTFGPVASIQNNETGQPAWLIVGVWRGNLFSFNQTTTSDSANTQENNVSGIEGAVFSSNLRMIMLNGSAPHTHIITNFRLSSVSSNENGTTIYTGTSTVSMPEGPIVGVPTTIKVSGELISIHPDPSAVHNHFGDTQIYGAKATHHEKDYGGPRQAGDASFQQQHLQHAE
ncbi:MAG: hypothetical protein M3115_00600 [Thermoproteota archaeon]|nr:hypothetical protein [Thermoproteota archaeon]